MQIRLLKWALEPYGKDGQVRAAGNCFGHQKFCDGTFVHTSIVMESWIGDGGDVLCLRTESGSQYGLLLEDMDVNRAVVRQTKECAGGLHLPDGFLDRAKAMVEGKEARTLAYADAQTEDGDLFLQVSGGGVLRAYFKKDGKACPLAVDCHVGMFQDSVLVRKYGLADYRYFPYPCRLETYHASSGIKRLVIENVGKETVEVDCKRYLPGVVERTAMTRESYQEGLLSPDCVDGKCMLSDLFNNGK